MSIKKSTGKWAGAGLMAAFASSLCCITPLLALLAGTTGMASTFSWVEPARPYLIALTVAVLGFAWYQKLQPAPAAGADCETDACGCETGKTPFFQTKAFLGIVTVFAGLMLAFPYFSPLFYPSKNKAAVVANAADVQTATFDIEGMTCGGCEAHVEQAVNELPGIVEVGASFAGENAVVKFDRTKTTPEKIKAAIDGTGYSVTGLRLAESTEIKLPD